MLKRPPAQSRQTASSGLTMIELLVVLTLLAALMIFFTIQIVAYLNRSRDSIRKSHLEKYRVALEEYHNDRRTYPPANIFTDCGGDGLSPYLPEIYCDPITGEPYRYVLNPDGTGYALYTALVNEEDPIIADRGCDDGCGPDDDGDGSGDYNYGITDEQAAIGDDADIVILPTCTGPSGPYCTPNQCVACCPGIGWRCNGLGNACVKDVRCN